MSRAQWTKREVRDEAGERQGSDYEDLLSSTAERKQRKMRAEGCPVDLRPVT